MLNPQVFKRVLFRDVELLKKRLQFLESKEQPIPFVVRELDALRRMITFFEGGHEVYVRSDCGEIAPRAQAEEILWR